MNKTFSAFTDEELKNLNINVSYKVFENSYKVLPEKIIEHREYFKSNGRGFGEDPFHAMWYYLFQQYQPKNVLEIGVFRGQTLSLFNLLSKFFDYECSVTGISPLEAVNDSVSSFPTDVNYEEDIIKNFNHFNLGDPNLVRSSSIERKARQVIKSKKWDLIYIDGNHDMPYVISDYMNCVDALSDNGIMVIDDSSLYRGLEIQGAFKGHVAPSQVLDAIAVNELQHILTVGHNNVLRNVQ
jgi:hypothetical protein